MNDNVATRSYADQTIVKSFVIKTTFFSLENIIRLSQ